MTDNEIAEKAAEKIATNIDNASQAMGGPRFLFQEMIAEQKAVILSAITAARERDIEEESLQFLREYDEGKHRISEQDEEALKKMWPSLLAKIRKISAAKREQANTEQVAKWLEEFAREVDSERSLSMLPKTPESWQGFISDARKFQKALGLPEADVSAGDPTRQKELLRLYVHALDGIWEHNEAARTAVRIHFGTCHPGDVWQLAGIDQVTRKDCASSVPSASPAYGASGVSAEGEKLPNEWVDVEEWTERGCGVYVTPELEELVATAESPVNAAKFSIRHNSTCATLRAEIARLRKILEEKGAEI